MLRYDHVIWDWNGTIVDDLPLVVDVMNGLLRARGLAELTVDRYRDVFDFPVRHYYQALGLDFALEPFEALAAEWIGGYQARWREAVLHEGVREVIDALRQGGVSQSVLSAAEQELLLEQAGHFGVTDDFAALVGIDDHHAESKVEHGRRWLVSSGLDPGRVLLIGDTTHDYEVGMALGVSVVLVADGHQSRARLERCGVPVVQSLAGILASDALRE